MSYQDPRPQGNFMTPVFQHFPAYPIKTMWLGEGGSAQNFGADASFPLRGPDCHGAHGSLKMATPRTPPLMRMALPQNSMMSGRSTSIGTTP